MLKVIIADDERVIRETISRLIDWKGLELELVGQCKNGIEAYNAILDESPDIVMTDIKMPGLSGIELIEKISSTNLTTQFILLSGYGEFNYAQSAMKYGVRHYLLKPCSEEQIIASLKDVIYDCYQKRAARQIEQQQALLQDTLRQNVMFSILSEATTSPGTDYSAMYHTYQKYLDFEQAAYRMMCLHGVLEEELPRYYDALAEYHHSHAPGLLLYGVYVHGTLTVFSQQYDADASALDALTDSLAAGSPQPIRRERKAFANLTELLNDLLGEITRYGTIVYLNGSRFVTTCNYHGVIHAVKELCARICALQKEGGEAHGEEIAACLDDLRLRLEGIVNPDFLIQLAATILLSFSSASLFFTSEEATELALELQQYSSPEEIRAALFSRLIPAVSTPCSDAEDCTDFILRVQQYVRDNISNPNLTLKWIAENYLYMNVDYVSRKFVRQTGQKFSAYLTDVRIQCAKHLMSESGADNLYSIAEQVGCGNNPQYFSQIFKKNTGMTPSAYVKQLRAGAQENA